MVKDQAALDRALNALADSLSDEAPDTTWIADLPEAPPLPAEPDAVVAVVLPAVQR